MKNEFLIVNFPLKIEKQKLPFNSHFKIGMEKDIFRYFNYDSKLKIKK